MPLAVKMEWHRSKIAKELLDTERQYVNALKLLKKVRWRFAGSHVQHKKTCVVTPSMSVLLNIVCSGSWTGSSETTRSTRCSRRSIGR